MYKYIYIHIYILFYSIKYIVLYTFIHSIIFYSIKYMYIYIYIFIRIAKKSNATKQYGNPWVSSENDLLGGIPLWFGSRNCRGTPRAHRTISRVDFLITVHFSWKYGQKYHGLLFFLWKTILEGTEAFSHPHGHGRYPPSFLQLFFDSSHSTNGYFGGPTEKRSLLTPTLVNSAKPHFTVVINPLWPNGQCNRGELPHDPDFFDRFSRN